MTLLALLSGLATADRAAAAPAVPAAMGSLVLFAEGAAQAERGDKDRRPMAAVPDRRVASQARCKPRRGAAEHLPGFLTGSDRALE
ncbi:hypothetical protein [Sphingopyxis sp. MWB1]|uniref:hypothetical protein n=1 Tax=Sphingopyxis sp. MWB1 TaxID=1537715 RepID=UPI001F415A81|nr:hypothetical protein [Sphingopyxis sp. MWB1]